MTTIRIASIVFLPILVLSCGQINDRTAVEAVNFDPQMVEEYNRIHENNRFMFAYDPDTLSLAITLMDGLISQDPDFFPAYISKQIYQCRIGDKLGALETLKEIYTRNPKEIYVLPTISMIYERAGQVDSSRYYLNLAISRFEDRCTMNTCPNDDQVNLIFLMFYRGDISEVVALENLRQVVDNDDYIYYSTLWQDFDRDDFLDNVCEMSISFD